MENGSLNASTLMLNESQGLTEVSHCVSRKTCVGLMYAPFIGG